MPEVYVFSIDYALLHLARNHNYVFSLSLSLSIYIYIYVYIYTRIISSKMDKLSYHSETFDSFDSKEGKNAE